MKNNVSWKNMSEKQLMHGTKLAIENAVELAKDAQLLLEHKRFTRAYTLFHLSNEEVGKAFLLIDLAMRRIIESMEDKYKLNIEPVDYAEINNIFHGHKSKTKRILNAQLTFFRMGLEMTKVKLSPEQVVVMQQKMDELNKDLENVGRLNELKNLSLYLALEGTDFISPNQNITSEMAEQIKSKTVFQLDLLQMILENEATLGNFLILYFFSENKPIQP